MKRRPVCGSPQRSCPSRSLRKPRTGRDCRVDTDQSRRPVPGRGGRFPVHQSAGGGKCRDSEKIGEAERVAADPSPVSLEPSPGSLTGPGEGNLVRRFRWELAEHRVDVDQRLVHHLFAGADLHGRHRGVAAVAAFAGGFDRGEVHVVAVAVAEEQRVLHVGALLQAVGMVAEELARSADQGQLAVEQHGGQLGLDAAGELLGIVFHQLGKERLFEHRDQDEIAEVDAAGELEAIDLGLNRGFVGHCRSRSTAPGATTWSPRASPYCVPVSPPRLGLISPDAPCMNTQLVFMTIRRDSAWRRDSRPRT